MTARITAMLIIDRIARKFKTQLMGFPLVGNSDNITREQLEALNDQYGGELEIFGKRSETGYRMIILKTEKVQSPRGMKSAVRKFADAMTEHLGLNVLTQA